MTRKKTHEEFVEEVKMLEGDNYTVLGEYKGNKIKILMRHNECGGTWEIAPSKFITGRRCAHCKNKRISEAKRANEDVAVEELLKKRQDIEYVDGYESKKSKITVKGKKCGHEWQAVYGNLVRGSGCPVCHGMKDTETFKKEIESKYPNEYVVIGEYVNNRTPISIRHKDCGYEWEVIPKDLLRKFRCPQCNKSLGEKMVRDYLTSAQIPFEEQTKMPGCSYKSDLKFDFKVELNGNIYMIEFDGQQHEPGYNRMFYSDENLIRDNVKNDYCKANGIPLLRLAYWSIRNDLYIRQINKFLNIEGSTTIENKGALI